MKDTSTQSKTSEDRDFPANPMEKPGYRLEFCDNFQAAALDTSKWVPYYLPQWSTKPLAAARYALPGHCLQLHIDADQQPWCPDYDGNIRVSGLQTGCYSGPLGSNIGQHRFNPDLVVTEAQPTIKNYTPQYGFFETRLKAVPLPGYMVALWMIGFEEDPEACGEICICELFGSHITAEASQNGYGLHPFNDPAITDEFYQEMLPINAANYHLYAAEWTPTHVDFYVDNVKTKTIRQSPTYPMQFMLTIYEFPAQLTSASLNTPWPKTLEVDYVRGYKPIHGYEAV
ncbi:MAG: glycoside hydrolase family 16 protein [Anaerolineaceae bacterium]|nr:glycoside hydrolase family 16 protein [Anaerolineaceae bacterium]MCB9101888.1 glycoside hydrolase family 16 protein [Anaerolineales bacterium]